MNLVRVSRVLRDEGRIRRCHRPERARTAPRRSRLRRFRCRYCRSRLGTLDPEAWHRDQPGRRLAGVAAAVAAAFAVPTGVVRLAFIVLTFLHFVGPLLYG